MKGVILSQLTWEEAQNAYETYSIVMLPIGAGTKEHGVHLPCGTDYFIIEELAARVVDACPVIMLPTLPYAYYPAFIDWPGSVSIKADHFMGFIGDIIKSFVKHGIRKFLILDGGVSTQHPLKILSSDLHNELGILVAVTNILEIGNEVKNEVCEQEWGGHADEVETSSMLSINRNKVKMNYAVEEYSHKAPGSCSKNGGQKVFLGRKVTTKSGISGNASLATVEKGEKILAAQTNDIITFIDYFKRVDI